MLEKHSEIWNKVSKFVEKGVDSEPAYNNCLKTKIKFYEEKINANFQGSQYIFLSTILIYSVFRTGKNYYPQVFLEECNYVAKKKCLNILLKI